MEKNFRQRPIISASFLSICLFVGLVFSGYLEYSEVDIFSPNLCFEDQDLGTLTTVEKVKFNPSISHFDHSLLPVCIPFQIPLFVFPVSLDNQINNPIRC
jgi:hypothetical protein